MKKVTEKQIYLSLASVVLCLTLLLGTTLAWFSSGVTAPKNRIVTGNLEVKLSYAKDISDDTVDWKPVTEATNVFAADNESGEILWEPGRIQVVYFKLENTGELNLRYTLATFVASEKEGIRAGSDVPFKLSEYLKVALVSIEKDKSGNPETDSLNTREKALSEIASKDSTLAQGAELTGGLEVTSAGTDSSNHHEAYFALVVTVPTDVANQINYESLDVDPNPNKPDLNMGISLNAVQAVGEVKDSYSTSDETYDSDLKDYTVVSAEAPLRAALKANKKVLMAGDIELTEPIDEIAANCLLDMNGHTLTLNLAKKAGEADEGQASKVAFKLVSGSGLTVRNGSFAITDCHTVFDVAGTLNLDKVEIGKTAYSDVVAKVSGIMTVKDSDLTACLKAVDLAAAGKLNVSGKSYLEANTAVYAADGAEIKIAAGASLTGVDSTGQALYYDGAKNDGKVKIDEGVTVSPANSVNYKSN